MHTEKFKLPRIFVLSKMFETTFCSLYKYYVGHCLLSVAQVNDMAIVKLALFPYSGTTSIIKPNMLDPLDTVTRDQLYLMEPA